MKTHVLGLALSGLSIVLLGAAVAVAQTAPPDAPAQGVGYDLVSAANMDQPASDLAASNPAPADKPAADCGCADECDPCCDSGRWFGEAEFLFLRYHRADGQRVGDDPPGDNVNENPF